jgi:tRNA (mo5U34)-methyltransferase
MSETAQTLPVTSDDPRLLNWYHTIELGNGIVSQGVYDHRPVVDRYGLPTSLKGKTALDVGTFDGFWAFELEQRGAEKVVAIDVPTIGDFDLLPHVKATMGSELERRSHFDLAHSMRKSRVERRICSVYDLGPDTVGTFDVTFCGDVLLHLFNPFQALLNIRSVTRELAVIQTTIDESIEKQHPDAPWLRFGQRAYERVLGDQCTYWLFSTRALQEMMEYAGFRSTEPQGLFQVPRGPLCTSVVGRV